MGFSVLLLCLSADWPWAIRHRLLWLSGRAAGSCESLHCSQPAEFPQRVFHLPTAAARARQHRPLCCCWREDGLGGAHRVPAGDGLLPTREFWWVAWAGRALSTPPRKWKNKTGKRISNSRLKLYYFISLSKRIWGESRKGGPWYSPSSA